MRVVYDIETLKNAFTITFLDIDTLKIYQFVIHKDRDDTKALKAFLDGCILMIGFNNLDFDYPVLHYILTSKTTATKIYSEAQRIIELKNSEGFTAIRDPLIPQMDLFQIHHFSNPARACSLKFLAVNMGMENILDMPIHHSEEITIDQISTILEYNLNDVMVTHELYKRSESKIKLREKLSEKYGADMTNFPDPKIGETIILTKLSEKLNTPVKTLKKCRTFRKDLRLRDCILPTITFKTNEFNKVLKQFQNMVVNDTRSSSDIIANFDDVLYYFGMGGLHACRANGVYRSISTCDVSGYYPSLAISQGFYPQQFGREFVQVFSEIAKERAMYPKGSDESTGLKLSQNGVVGKSNSEYSPFYDPKFFCNITINGQLMLAMLCERITLLECGRIIMANTDGIEVEVTNKEKFMWLCGEWEKKFGLKLEHDSYKLIAIANVNNYLSLSTSGKVKEKGLFELQKELHKDHSMPVVTRAVREYFLNKTPIEDTINKAEEKDFLIGDRAKTGYFELRGLKNGELYKHKLPKTIRYYVSKDGGTLVKKGTKGVNEITVQKGYRVTLMNKLEQFRFINKQFYVKEARKLIDSIIQ